MITDDEISNLEFVVESNIDNGLSMMIVGVETLGKLLEEIKFRRQRQTELQETGTKLALRNRELERELKEVKAELQRLNDYIDGCLL